VIPTGLRVHPGVGSFLGSTALSLGAFPVAGATHNVTLSFTPEMRLVPGDTISLRLTAFTGASGDRRVYGASAGQLSAAWILGQEVLTATVTSPIEEREPVLFSVIPYTLHPSPYTLHHTPYTPRPAPHTRHPPPTLHPTTYTLHPELSTLKPEHTNPRPRAPNP